MSGHSVLLKAGGFMLHRYWRGSPLGSFLQAANFAGVDSERLYREPCPQAEHEADNANHEPDQSSLAGIKPHAGTLVLRKATSVGDAEHFIEQPAWQTFDQAV